MGYWTRSNGIEVDNWSRIRTSWESAGFDKSNVKDKCNCRRIAHRMENRPKMWAGTMVFPRTLTFKVPRINTWFISEVPSFASSKQCVGSQWEVYIVTLWPRSWSPTAASITSRSAPPAINVVREQIYLFRDQDEWMRCPSVLFFPFMRILFSLMLFPPAAWNGEEWHVSKWHFLVLS